MSTVKNLNVNRNAFGKKKIYKIVVTTAIVVLATLISLGLYNAHTDKAETNQIETIIEYYGEDSVEDKILEYIALSEEMNSLNLEKYSADSSLYEKHSISMELKTPEEIKSLITDFKKFDSSFSAHEITEISDFIYTVLNLKKQEQLTNKYIYTVGYSVANENVTDATKKYAAEVFGIFDPKDITFKYSASSSSGEEYITLVNENESPYDYDDVVYTLKQNFNNKDERNIKEGVKAMVNTNTQYDRNNNDNDNYNQARNKYIKDALGQSVKLEKIVENEDIYNKNLASKLK